MVKRIMRQLSEEHGLPLEVIEQIVRSPFKFTAQIIAEGEFKPVRHPYLGVFAVKPGRLEKLNKHKE